MFRRFKPFLLWICEEIRFVTMKLMLKLFYLFKSIFMLKSLNQIEATE